MGKSRGNRLNKNSLYLNWLDINIVYGYQIAFCEEESDWEEIDDNVSLPRKIYGNFQSIIWGENEYITTLPQLNVKIDNLNYTFNGLSALKSVDLSKVKLLDNTTMSGVISTFDGCSDLETIIGLPIFEGVTTNTLNTFKECASLKNLSFTGGGEINTINDLDLSDCIVFSEQSYLNVAFRLSSNSQNKTLIASTQSANTPLSKHVRLNQDGKGLEFCNAGDSGDLGTLSEYITTNKGWTLTLV
ncbi:MAG: hypothetical protein J6S67_26170 [Methanobrevibacter sp.]|nr:hypothetical protein [Methanobrevibacter sp.]